MAADENPAGRCRPVIGYELNFESEARAVVEAALDSYGPAARAQRDVCTLFSWDPSWTPSAPSVRAMPFPLQPFVSTNALAVPTERLGDVCVQAWLRAAELAGVGGDGDEDVDGLPAVAKDSFVRAVRLAGALSLCARDGGLLDAPYDHLLLLLSAASAAYDCSPDADHIRKVSMRGDATLDQASASAAAAAARTAAVQRDGRPGDDEVARWRARAAGAARRFAADALQRVARGSAELMPGTAGFYHSHYRLPPLLAHQAFLFLIVDWAHTAPDDEPAPATPLTPLLPPGRDASSVAHFYSLPPSVREDIRAARVCWIVGSAP